jgi:hypothetical protein
VLALHALHAERLERRMDRVEIVPAIRFADHGALSFAPHARLSWSGPFRVCGSAVGVFDSFQERVLAVYMRAFNPRVEFRAPVKPAFSDHAGRDVRGDFMVEQFVAQTAHIPAGVRPRQESALAKRDALFHG